MDVCHPTETFEDYLIEVTHNIKTYIYSSFHD